MSFATIAAAGFLVPQANASPVVVSEVDTHLNAASKYFLRVDGKPFYPLEVQVRFDKLRYWWGWNAHAREACLAQAAKDGFNTVAIPVQWYEIEPTKNKFDWTIIDEYLTNAWRHGLKVELLWFGQNSGGHVQWLGDDAKNPVHLRVPDYVLYSPNPKSNETISEYRIRRDISAYTLDLADDRLLAREALVLGKFMAHIAEWDAHHQNSHLVIGVQLGNEVHGLDGIPIPAALALAYYSKLGEVVKQGPYRIWTRMNCIWIDTASRIIENEKLRESIGTNIDFVGTDLYREYGTTISEVHHGLPYVGRNYRMIMECGADDHEAGVFQLAALAGNNALNFYDFCGPDNNGMYRREGSDGFVPRGDNPAAIRLVNRILRAVNADVAMRSQGCGLFVHNWDGHQPAGTAGVGGLCFYPSTPTSQGISLQHDASSIIVLTTHGGTFTWPALLGVASAEKGELADGKGPWIKQEEIELHGRSIQLAAGDVVRLTTATSAAIPQRVYEAEFGQLGGAAVVEASVDSLGFAANGYVHFRRAGESVSWLHIEDFGRKRHRIEFRYANGAKQLWPVCVFINGLPHKLEFPPTGGWDVYETVGIEADLLPGPTNAINLETVGDCESNLDELLIF